MTREVGGFRLGDGAATLAVLGSDATRRAHLTIVYWKMVRTECGVRCGKKGSECARDAFDPGCALVRKSLRGRENGAWTVVLLFVG
jgi:hypothetical protein